MRRRTKIVTAGVLVGGPVLLLLGLLLYLRFADLSRWRDTAAAALSDALGREVRITGEFEPEIGRTTRLVAGGVTIANADWSDEPAMLAVDRVEAEIDLRSLFSGPLIIRDVRVAGVRLVFETDREGRLNWALGRRGRRSPNAGPFRLVIGRAVVEDLEILYRSPATSRELELAVERFESSLDGSGLLDVELDGSFRGRDLHLAGWIGTLSGLIRGREVEHDLEGRFGNVHFATAGTIAHLAALDGVAATVEVHGTGPGALRSLLSLPDGLDTPFTLTAEVAPAAAGNRVRVEADLGGIEVRAQGSLDALRRPRVVDATVAASGPSLRNLGALAGVPDLANRPFSLAGGVRWEGFPITIRDLRARVGDNTLAADGVLGAPPAMLGTDFRLEGAGPDLASLAAPAGLSLPRDSYAVSGRVVRVDRGVRVESVNAQIGQASLTASGFVGDPPEHTGTALVIDAGGPSLAPFSGLLGVQLPDRPFAFEGRLAESRQALLLQGLSVRLGESTVALDGRLTTGRSRSGSVLTILAGGTDASELAAVTGLQRLPADPWTADGTIHILDRGFQLRDFAATLGSLAARVDGRVMPGPDFVGTDLTVHAEDTDLSHPASLAGLSGLPAPPVRIDGQVRVEAAGVRLDEIRATVDGIDIGADGLIGLGTGLAGTDLEIEVRGADLAALGALVSRPGLPREPFSMTGRLRVADGVWETDGLEANAGGARLHLSGSLVPAGGLAGTDLRIDLTGPDLRRAGTLVAGLVAVPELPAEPFSLTTRVGVDPAGYRIESFRATLADALATIEGRVGALPQLVGTDLTIVADGPDASLFRALTGATVPVAPFRVRGRIRNSSESLGFEHLVVQLGDHRASVHGRLGRPPRFVGTDLEVEAAGPGSGLIRDLSGIAWLPDLPFEIRGRFDGTPERFAGEDLSARVGASDLRGAFDVDTTGKPSLTARLESKLLDLEPFLPRHAEDGPPPDVVAQGADSDPVKALFSDRPIDFARLQGFDADVELEVGDLQLPLQRFRDIEVRVELSDGHLEVPRLAAVGQRGGSGAGRLILEPSGEAYRLQGELDLDGIRLVAPEAGSDGSAARPPVDVDVVLSASGLSPHELAVSSSGSIQVVAGPGTLDNSLLDVFTAPIIATLLKAFNPFAKEGKTPELECGVVLVTFGDGTARLDPMVLKSSAMTMIGSGTVDLETERLNFEWVTKPRKGIGLSGTMLTNPYIRLGGTLANPVLQLREADAVISTGAAVATAGISLAVRGLWDRITAERNVCKKAHKKIAASR
ncbi:MAG TPA: AsmA-like C-terminal region-containing protein [Candidatus Sulfomarinibacteraceae bacterium]|nr:AsmA-like C-terminal region-containing protein [Candidatus Sulfomarinibacteraceae bacterium]